MKTFLVILTAAVTLSIFSFLGFNGTVPTVVITMFFLREIL